MSGRGRPSLSDKAYRIIKRKIVRCELAPGAPVSENELTAEIGSSRTPVREALSKLEKEDLVTIYPKRGVFINSVSIKDVNDIYSLREVLEPYAAALAAPVMDLDRVGRFAAIWRDPTHQYGAEEHMELDHEFHIAIAEASGNGYLIDFLGRLYDQVSRIRFISLQGNLARYREIRHEHMGIIERLMERDADGSASAMRDHLEKAHRTALEMFSKVPGIPLVR
jgi:DNA-binding GntR family transcriptional regulator